MLPPAVVDALRSLTPLADDPTALATLTARWAEQPLADAALLAAPALAAADMLDRALPALTRSTNGTADLAQLFGQPGGGLLFAWCAASAARRDARLAPILASAAKHPELTARVASVARARVLQGPLLDALACAPMIGAGALEPTGDGVQVQARMEILIWEAGAAALQLPDLGAWVFGSTEVFEALVGAPSKGSLRGRVLAARCLEVCARGLPPNAPPETMGRTLQVLQPLLLHPEPLVWVHASRALGRLAGVIDALQGTLLDWLQNDSELLRQRAVTAFASQPVEMLKVLAAQLSSILDDPKQEPWVLAAAAAATPYLFFERRDLWDKLCARITAGDGGAVAGRALARGLGALWRRGMHQAAVEVPLRQLRELARRAHSDSVDEWRRWLEVIAATDPIDGAERDPLDLEQGIENLVRLAAQYDDEEADARAARFAVALLPTFHEARRTALDEERPRRRAAGLHAAEGIARAMALGMWTPLLRTRPSGVPVPEPDLKETWEQIARAPEELLDILAERRDAAALEDAVTEPIDEEVHAALEVLAVRLGGYALDACDAGMGLAPGRGPAAHQTCLWLRKLPGLVDGSREFPPALRTALSALFWRLVDTTRGAAQGEFDDVRWLGPFAAWWALVVDRPVVLLQLASALPMLAPGALDHCCERSDTIRAALSSDPAKAADGQWGWAVARDLSDLHADDTELSHALLGLAAALAGFAHAAGPNGDLDELCLPLVLAAERLFGALSDPVTALHTAPRATSTNTDGARRVAALVARAIRGRDLSSLGVWFASLGPVTSALVEAAVTAAVRRTPPPPPQPKKPDVRTIEGYELIRPLGEGGVGTVWLVRKPGADRFFVLKIPKKDALDGATDGEREAILASFVEEARALAGLYHPNVASIIDRGVSGGMPFLVLEYLIGADLKAYAGARNMSLFELRQVVSESCAGLASLHSAGLVHRDIKPANLWLRLPLAGGVGFDPAQHRDPARTPPLTTVVIDFGMVRPMRVGQEAVGRFVAGTPGYIAPEQVLDPMELDGRADVYALAGTIYNVTTGRTFFDDIESLRERILAHMQRDPLADLERVRNFPAGMARLLRAATSRSPLDRPTPLEFGREFATLL